MTPELTALQHLASPLVGASSLMEIRLFESHGRHLSFPEDEDKVQPSDLAVNVQSMGEAGSETAVYLMRVELSLQEPSGEAGSEGNESHEVASISVTYGALYLLEDEAQEAPEDALDAFGQCVAAMALWPYIRAEVARLSEGMRLGPQLTLPMLTQQDLIDLAE